jgi:8-oxo-dGTP pyrophosphatase MutT (NUDIX family)
MANNSRHPIQQASAVPYRRRGEQIEFCLITSTGKGAWGFPKGIIDPGDTPVDTALKEAKEEAGLRGRIQGEPLGQYEYAKWGTTLLVTAYLMEVDAADNHWQEARLRKRHWCRADRARRMIVREELRGLLDAAVARLEA